MERTAGAARQQSRVSLSVRQWRQAQRPRDGPTVAGVPRGAQQAQEEAAGGGGEGRPGAGGARSRGGDRRGERGGGGPAARLEAAVGLRTAALELGWGSGCG